MVPYAGLEPTFAVSKTAVLPLDEKGMVARVGVEPTFSAYETDVLTVGRPCYGASQGARTLASGVSIPHSTI